MLSARQGSHRFMVTSEHRIHERRAGHCVVPGCTSASITVSAPVAVTVTDTGGAPIAARPSSG